MAEDVVIKMSAADAGLFRAWQEAKRGPEAMAKALGDLKAKSREAKSETDKLTLAAAEGAKRAAGSVGSMGNAAQGAASKFSVSAGSIVKGALGVGAALAGVQSVANLVMAEYESFLQRRRAAGELQVSLASSQAQALANLDTKEMSGGQLEKRVQQIAFNAKTDVGNVWAGAAGVLSARGTMTQEQALEQLEAQAVLNPWASASEQQSLAGSGLDIRKKFGGSATQSIGAMLAAQRMSRIESSQMFGQNAVPALVGLGNFGNTMGQATALYSAVTQEMADKTGQMSGSAVQNFARQVAEATGRVKGLEGKGTAERLDWLMSSAGEGTRKRLLGQAKAAAGQAGEMSVEAKAYTAIHGLLTSGSDIRKTYESLLASAPGIEGGDAAYQAAISAQGEVSTLATARLDASRLAMVQRAQQDPKIGAAGVVRKTVDDVLANAAGSNLKKEIMLKLIDAQMAMGEDPYEAGIDVVSDEWYARRKKIDEYERLKAVAAGGGTKAIGARATLKNFTVSDEERKSVDLLHEILDVLRARRDEAEKAQKVEVVANPAATEAARAAPGVSPAVMAAGRFGGL